MNPSENTKTFSVWSFMLPFAIWPAIIFYPLMLFPQTPVAEKKDQISQINYELPDSVMLNLQKIENINARIDYLLTTANNLENDKPEEAINVATHALALSLKFSDTFRVALSYDLIGTGYEYAGQFTNALENYGKSAQKKENLYHADTTNRKIANSLAVTYLHIGNAFLYQGLYSMALEYFFKSLKLVNIIQDDALMAKVYNNIGAVYDNIKDMPLAFSYHIKSLNLKMKMGDKKGISSSYANIGNCYSTLNKCDSALHFYFLSLEIKKEINDLKGQALLLNNISEEYLRAGQLDNALRYGTQSLKICNQINSPYQTSSTLINLSKIYKMKGQKQKAFDHLKEAYKMIARIQSYEYLRDISSELYQICKDNNDYKNALFYHEQFKTASDSLNNLDQAKKLTRLELQYRFEKETTDRQNLFEQRELKYRDEIAWQKKQIYFFLGIICITLVFSWFIYRSYLLRKRDNKILKIRNAEITRQKEELKLISEKALQSNRQVIESEKKYKRLVEGISDQYFFYTSDRMGKYTYASPSVFTILGYKPVDFCNGFESFIVHDERYRKMLHSTQYTWRGLQQDPYEIEIKAYNGTFKIIEVIDVPVIDEEGYVVAVESIAQNITDRKHADDALRKSEEQLSAIFRHAAIGIELVDIEGNILFINDHLAGMLGYSKNEIRSHNKSEITHPDDRELHELNFRKLLNQEIDSYRIEKRYIRKDNTEFWGDVSITPMRDILGNMTNIIGVILDITDKKKATHDLMERESELREAVAIRDRLFQIIAHDLRGPVGTAKSIIEFICQSPENYSAEETAETLHDINISLQNTYFLLENLLLWARIQRHQVVYQPTHHDLRSLIDEAFESLQSVLKEKNLSLVIDCQNPVVAWCDINLALAILRNLISNAVKFSQPGNEIKISISSDAHQAIVKLTDHGVGMGHEMIEKLKTTGSCPSTHGTQGEKGSGLGLAICKEFIEKQNGHWEIMSEPGNGTSFVFSFPMHHG